MKRGQERRERGSKKTKPEKRRALPALSSLPLHTYHDYQSVDGIQRHPTTVAWGKSKRRKRKEKGQGTAQTDSGPTKTNGKEIASSTTRVVVTSAWFSGLHTVQI